ncbi:HPP family protein [Methylobacterium sp. J-070]|uniref:HPP family protein n=1 Tax=Methylobacterium sp. J-070 TaxID=2836650 RepID=UPI00391E049E
MRDRAIACVGALLAIALTGLISGSILGHGPHIPLIVAPMGASAVLLFAVPASPLARPWSIVGGNTLSAMAGVATARLISDPILAIGIGVSSAIAIMSLTRSLHPPGGAAALTALVGGPSVAASGFLFPFVPVCLNSLVLVGLGIAFHRLSGHRYPHARASGPGDATGAPRASPQATVGFREEDLDATLTSLHETLDIDRTDLDGLLREMEARTSLRAGEGVTCLAVMSREPVTIGLHEPTAHARRLLVAHDVRTIPVLDAAGRLAGVIGFRDLARHPNATRVGQAMSEASTADPAEAAASLAPRFIDGHTHAVVVVAPDRNVVGVVTSTDILAMRARASAPGRPAPARGT